MTLLQQLVLSKLTTAILGLAKPDKLARLALKKVQKESTARFRVRFSAPGATAWAISFYNLACR